jgi:hypothetical protein
MVCLIRSNVGNVPSHVSNRTLSTMKGRSFSTQAVKSGSISNKINNVINSPAFEIYELLVTGAVLIGTVGGAVWGGLNQSRVESDASSFERSMKIAGAMVVKGLKTGAFCAYYVGLPIISVPHSVYLYTKDQKNQYD